MIGLVITLVFNTLGVRDSARQQKRTREAAQLQLFTQLDQELNGAVAALNSTPIDPRHLTPRQRAQLDQAYDELNYMAWLFNNRYLTLPGTEQLVLNRLRCAYQSAAFLGKKSKLPEVRKAVGPNPRCDSSRS